MSETGIRFKWNDVESAFDLSDLTFREAEDIERIFGGPLREFRESCKKGYMGALKVLVWMAQRRLNPELKFTDFDDVKLDAVEVISDEENADPPQAGHGPADTKQ